MILQSLAGLPAFLLYFCTGIVAIVAYHRRASLDGRLDLNFDGRLSGSDPNSPVSPQSSRFHLCLTFQMADAVPNGFHASGKCCRNQHP
jgi:hypothetical protein